jgi:hypothetical protein
MTLVAVHRSIGGTFGISLAARDVHGACRLLRTSPFPWREA